MKLKMSDKERLMSKEDEETHTTAREHAYTRRGEKG
jgi:hypothetical protein